MKGVRVGRRAAAIAAGAACAAAVACGAPAEERRGLAAEPELRIWAPPVVLWEAGAVRRVDFSIENPTRRTVAVAAPDPALARVDVLAGPESVRVCGVAPAERAAPGARVALAPGDRVAVRVDLEEACGDVPPGTYRYEISYRAAAPAGAGAGAFSGILGVRYGQVLVSAPSAEAGSLGAAPPPPGPARRGRAERPPTGRGGARGAEPGRR